MIDNKQQMESSLAANVSETASATHCFNRSRGVCHASPSVNSQQPLQKNTNRPAHVSSVQQETNLNVTPVLYNSAAIF